MLPRLLTLLSLAACFVLPPTTLHAQAKRPNIVFIMSDDHASAAISSYGSILAKVFKTPHLDRLAQSGMRFTNSLVTNSICTPSRAAILTGQYSHRNGVYTLNDPIDPAKIHIGHLLQRLGYQTAIFGKWHLINDPTGFHSWNILPGQGQYINPKLRAMGEKIKDYQGYSEDVITDFSLKWMKERDQGKPFFLCCHYKAPHRPWNPAPRFEKMFDGITIPEPETLLDDYQGRAKQTADIRMRIGQDMTLTDLGVPVRKDLDANALRKWAYQIYMKRYLACCAAVDENVGRILDFLDKEGLAENTIVIYTSDQGFFLGEHGWYDKRQMYEPCLTTPLIVRWPGRTKPGSVNHDMVLNIDHAPTWLEILQAEIPRDMQGKSYKAILEGKTPADWRTSMYYRYWMHLDGSHNVPAQYGVRTKDYTLIHFYGKALGMKGAKNVDREPEWELYDRAKDPQMMRNVYSDPAYSRVVEELKTELARLRKELGDDR